MNETQPNDLSEYSKRYIATAILHEDYSKYMPEQVLNSKSMFFLCTERDELKLTGKFISYFEVIESIADSYVNDSLESSKDIRKVLDFIKAERNNPEAYKHMVVILDGEMDNPEPDYIHLKRDRKLMIDSGFLDSVKEFLI